MPEHTSCSVLRWHMSVKQLPPGESACGGKQSQRGTPTAAVMLKTGAVRIASSAATHWGLFQPPPSELLHASGEPAMKGKHSPSPPHTWLEAGS